jgi:hypothetical protein
MLRQDRLRYANPKHCRTRAYISAVVGAFPLGNTIYRFPHVQAIPVGPIIRRAMGFLLGPFVFSAEGDSGSWVLCEESGAWMGMIVGGDAAARTSYIADADALLTFFTLELQRVNALNQDATLESISLE